MKRYFRQSSVFWLAGATVAAVGCSSDRVGPEPVEIVEVRVNPESAILPLGATLQLVPQAVDSVGGEIGGVQFTWSSNHPEIIGVSGAGVVTGLSAGSATVSASAGGQTGSALIITSQSVSTVSVTPSPAALAVGESIQLTAQPADQQGLPVGLAVAWTSDDEAVAMVSSSGLVEALVPGTATIIATSQGKTGAAMVTVTATPVPVNAVTVAPSSASVAPGGSVQLTAVPQDGTGNVLAGRSIVWTSSSPAVAAVSAAALVIGLTAGSATITATSEGVDGTAQVIVDPGSAVASITISPGNSVVTTGTHLQLTAAARDAAGTPLLAHAFTWTSSAPLKAQVSPTGVVTGVSPGGPVTITAAAEAVLATAVVTVIATPASTIAVAPDPVAFALGGQLRLRAEPRDEAGKPLTNRPVVWTSSNPSVATVSGENVNGVALFGVAMGVGTGSATITATADGASATAEVTVTTLRFTSISVGSNKACGLTPSGAAFCWGSDPGLSGKQLTPVSVAGLSFNQVTAGDQHACGLTPAGVAYCWGENSWGQLGAGSAPSAECTIYDQARTACPTPVPVSGGLTFASLSAGAAHTCGLLNDGTAYCWGLNTAGQLGAPGGASCFYPCSTVPILVEGGHKFSTVSAGQIHTCAVSLAQAAYCWGDNSLGQLGDGSTTSRTTPTAVLGGLPFASVDAGFQHTCGIAVGGLGFCWGSNGYGEVGHGAQTTIEDTPAAIFGGRTFTAVSAGARVSCGVTPGGAGYCWGQNSQGSLGTGDNSDSRTPVPIAGGLTFTSISVGNNLNVCGVANSQKGYCWGRRDTAGSVGPGIYLVTPTLVAGQP